jgi:hypothetical protein
MGASTGCSSDDVRRDLHRVGFVRIQDFGVNPLGVAREDRVTILVHSVGAADILPAQKVKPRTAHLEICPISDGGPVSEALPRDADPEFLQRLRAKTAPAHHLRHIVDAHAPSALMLEA